jgi:hypothetical protein
MNEASQNSRKFSNFAIIATELTDLRSSACTVLLLHHLAIGPDPRHGSNSAVRSSQHLRSHPKQVRGDRFGTLFGAIATLERALNRFSVRVNGEKCVGRLHAYATTV